MCNVAPAFVGKYKTKDNFWTENWGDNTKKFLMEYWVEINDLIGNEWWCCRVNIFYLYKKWLGNWMQMEFSKGHDETDLFLVMYTWNNNTTKLRRIKKNLST
jgi:hypothetical protein